MPNKPCLDPLAPEVVEPDNQPELAESHDITSGEVAVSGSNTQTGSGNYAQLLPVTLFQSGPQQQLSPVQAFLVQWTLTVPVPQQQLIPLTASLVQWAVQLQQQQQQAAAVVAETPEAAEAPAEAVEVAEEAEVLKVSEAELEAAEHAGSAGSELSRASTAASSSGGCSSGASSSGASSSSASSSSAASCAAPSGSDSSSGLNPNATKFRSGLEACPYEQIGLPCLTRPGGGCLRCDHFKQGKCKRKTTCKYCHCLTPRSSRGDEWPKSSHK